MKLLRTRFCAAMPRSSASASASPSGAGSRIGVGRAIDAGTSLSISARRDAAPITDSISASPSASMPTWRGMNSPALSSSASGFRADTNIAVPVNSRRPQDSLTSVSYAAWSMSEAVSAASLRRTLKNQPVASGSLLASEGSARNASLTSTTSPLTGM